MTVRSIFPARAWLTAFGAFVVFALAGCQDSYSPTGPSLDGPSLDLVATTLSTATGEEVQITTNEYPQVYPAISGDRIVWQDLRGDDVYPGNIYMYDLSTEQETQITTVSPGTAALPDISGDRIVWFDGRNGYPDEIYMYDLSTSTETQIANPLGDSYELAISGDWIVWREYTGTNKIYAFDLSAQDPTPTQITSDEANPGHAAISGNLVVWSDNQDIYMYDLSTNTETQITNDGTAFDQDFPVISGNRIVWWEPGDYWYGVLYMYDLSDQNPVPTRITSDAARPSQSAPAISGNWIVWVDNRNGGDESPNTDIYMYDLSTGTETQITTNTSRQSEPDVAGDRIVWQDERNVDPDANYWDPQNLDIYMHDASAPSLSPDAMLESLISTAEGTDGLSKGTVNKLNIALRQLEAGRTNPAVNSLQDFIEDVQDQSGKKISEEDASALIAAAQEIIDTILAGS